MKDKIKELVPYILIVIGVAWLSTAHYDISIWEMLPLAFSAKLLIHRDFSK